MAYLAGPAILAGIYQLIALVAALRRIGVRKTQESGFQPAVSILKPVHGRDPQFYEAIRSHALLDYPQYEILFGLNDPDDPARKDIARLAAEFPERQIRMIECPSNMPNAKVASLAEMARAARHPVLVINDSDIVVERDYLRMVVAPLENPGTGLVTCLYRASGANWPARGASADDLLFSSAFVLLHFRPGDHIRLQRSVVSFSGFGSVQALPLPPSRYRPTPHTGDAFGFRNREN